MKSIKEYTLSEQRVWKLLTACGAFMTGHFVLNSGAHSKHFVEKVLATNNPGVRMRFARAIAWHISCMETPPEVLVGTPMGAISLAATISDLTGIPLAWLEKKDGALTIRGANKAAVVGKIVAIIEDIITKGTNTTRSQEVLISEGGADKVVLVTCIVNRESFEMDDGTPIFSLAVAPPSGRIESFPAGECPLCDADKVITTDPGHGDSFLAELKSTNEPRWKVLSGQSAA